MATKYSDAQVRAVNKYRAKTYKMINVKLRIEDDSEIIESMEKARSEGMSYREWLRDLYYRKK